MALSDRLRDATKVLLGVSAYQKPDPRFGPQIGDKVVNEVRESLGGNIQPLPNTRLRWYLEDLEGAQYSADNGFMAPAAQLCSAMRRDGSLQGLLRGRTRGLLQLPKRFYGNDAIANDLRALNGSRSVFDEMMPPAELEVFNNDKLQLGVGVGELLPVPGRSYPVFCRLEPEFLQYRWSENRWYYNSIAGTLPITPGDGRWVLHLDNRLTPWRSGLWPALGRAFINKEHAIMYRSNYCAKLANPARLAYAPLGATEAQRLGFFQRILAWGVNTVLELPPGWEAKLLESNGRGWEVFQRQIDTSDLEYMIAINGQVLTTMGGTGFDGQDKAEANRQSQIQFDGDSLAYTINTQILPQFIATHYGETAVMNDATVVAWDTASSIDKERETRMLGQCADAIARLTVALAPFNRKPNVLELTTRYAIPTEEGAVVVADMPQAGSDAGAGELKTKKPDAPALSEKKPTDGDDVDIEDEDAAA